MRVFSVILMFLTSPASQLKYIGPFRKLRDRVPVEPGAFGKKTWPVNGSVPTGCAPRTLVNVKPAGSGCLKSTPVRVVVTPATVRDAVANSTLGSTTKTPFGVLNTPKSFLIWSSFRLELAG